MQENFLFYFPWSHLMLFYDFLIVSLLLIFLFLTILCCLEDAKKTKIEKKIDVFKVWLFCGMLWQYLPSTIQQQYAGCFLRNFFFSIESMKRWNKNFKHSSPRTPKVIICSYCFVLLVYFYNSSYCCCVLFFIVFTTKDKQLNVTYLTINNIIKHNIHGK